MVRVNRVKQAGISLQELLITMAILGIIAVVTIPNFNGYMKVSRAKGVVNEMVGALNLARQQAVTTRESHLFGASAATDTWEVWKGGEKVLGGEMPTGVTIETSLNFNFDSTGRCTNPTEYVGTTPSTQYVRLEAVIQSERIDRYIFEVSSVGRVKTTRDVVTP